MNPKESRSSLTGPGSGPGSGAGPRRNRAGSLALSVLAGATTLLGAGTTAAAFAAAQYAGGSAATQVCQPLPASPSPKPKPRPVRLQVPPLRLVKGVLRRLDRALAAPSSSPGPGNVDLCVSVAAVTGTAQPGQDAVYRIRVWPTGGAVDGVSVGVSVTAGRPSPSLPGAAFTDCGNGDNTATCTVGALPAAQASELQAQAEVPATAPSGDSVTLTATVTGAASGASGVGKAAAAATVSIVADPPTSSRPTPKPSHPGSSGPGRGHHDPSSPASLSSGLQPGSLPALSDSGGSTTIGNPSIAFPAITPGPSPAPDPPAPSATPVRTPYRASVAANVLPLNAGQLGGQVAGLIVLVLGVALVIVRVSLRRPGPR